jgi:ribosomal protein S18 acetylase RimI-like enzyme
MKCDHCQQTATYKCSVCGHFLCAEHVRFRTVCPECIAKARLQFVTKKIMSRDREEIRKMVTTFWGEEEQVTFDRTFTVHELQGYVARLDRKIVGFVSTANLREAILIVALGVLPEYQSSGIGKGLVLEAEREAARSNKKSMLVSTSNDDLPALAFYQSIGFQINEVKPNVIAEKHGRVLPGVGGLPVRDELRLRKVLSKSRRRDNH